ncbi:MAG: helix-turn-helix domain-containing protein [Lachnospiraceae bacterium]
MGEVRFDKALKLLEEKGFTTYRIRKENIISQSALQKLKKGGDIDTRTIVRLCDALQCQPGDLMEYVLDEE